MTEFSISATTIEPQLIHWPISASARAQLINLSENHTFLVTELDGSKTVLRVHRNGYHKRIQIESELMWMEALRADIDLSTPIALPGNNGKRIQTLGFSNGEQRYAVLFDFEEGREPVETDDLTAPFIQLGELAARCHNHAEQWERPHGFTRHRWTPETILKREGLWGDWRQSPGVGEDETIILNRLVQQLETDCAKYGEGNNRFGIIHADMRLANLLIHNRQTKLLDFDDCGFGWFMYDFAAAISFFEDSETVPDLLESWLGGYTRHRKITAPDRQHIDAMIMLRRMALQAWIGSHNETELGQSLAPDFAQTTVELADRYLTAGSVTN